jgi:hypothetical protein
MLFLILSQVNWLTGHFYLFTWQLNAYAILIIDAIFLLKFLRGCKYSLEKAKKKMDLTLTLRSALPEFFSGWDPMSPENQEALSLGYGPAICNFSKKLINYFFFFFIEQRFSPTTWI